MESALRFQDLEYYLVRKISQGIKQVFTLDDCKDILRNRFEVLSGVPDSNLSDVVSQVLNSLIRKEIIHDWSISGVPVYYHYRGDMPVHRYIESKILDAFRSCLSSGVVLSDVIDTNDTDGPDIITPSFTVEIETGLKKDITDLISRLQNRTLIKDNDTGDLIPVTCYVVVSNSEELSKYRDLGINQVGSKRNLPKLMDLKKFLRVVKSDLCSDIASWKSNVFVADLISFGGPDASD